MSSSASLRVGKGKAGGDFRAAGKDRAFFVRWEGLNKGQFPRGRERTGAQRLSSPAFLCVGKDSVSAQRERTGAFCALGRVEPGAVPAWREKARALCLATPASLRVGKGKAGGDSARRERTGAFLCVWKG